MMDLSMHTQFPSKQFLEFKHLAFCILVFCLAFSFGWWRFQQKDFHLLNPVLENAVDSKITLEGVVISEPEHRDKDLRFVLKTNEDKMLVKTNLYSEIEYGDRVKIEGKLEKPGIIEDEVTGKSFDYAAYLSKEDIYYTTSFSQAKIISHGNGNSIISFLLKIKKNFVSQMKKILPEPESSLLAGLLVSGKQALPENILEEFRNAGVAHIVVLSGYNITVVANFLFYIFSFLGIRIAGIFSVVGIGLFTLITGGTATVVRAAIMAVIAVSGKLFGRNYSASRALVFAGVLMVLQNPKILLLDPSFQLSFLATVAMIYVSSFVETFLSKVPETFQFRQIVSSTISTQLFVLPYLLFQIGKVSVVSLFSNLLILMFVPFTMLIGFISTTVSYFSAALAIPGAYVSHMLLWWMLSVAHFFGTLSWSNVSLSISIRSMWICYAVFFLILRSRNYSRMSAS
ncbi:MAG: Competence protein ComEC [Parcubacteria group bacterium]|nr:Competence protein ComEC [Parcubacteria group bacterium]